MPREVTVFLGRGGLARRLGVSETYVRILNIPPDALVDGRPAWTPATADRVKSDRLAKVSGRRPSGLR